jgi:hypothetical protein
MRQARMTNSVQISADALRAYVDAIEQTFGADVNYWFFREISDDAIKRATTTSLFGAGPT